MGDVDTSYRVEDDDANSTPWWAELREVINFARILVDADQLGACQHMVITFFETPWKWSAQHAIWRQSGCPTIDSGKQFDALIARFDDAEPDNCTGSYTSSPATVIRDRSGD